MISTTARDVKRCPFSERVHAIWQELRPQLSLSPASSGAWGVGAVEEVVPDVSASLRGLLVLLAGEVADAERDDLLPAATAMELLVRSMGGMSAPCPPSVLVGEVLYTRGLSLVARMHSGAVQVFADLAAHMVAEKWKMREVGLQLRTTEEEYLEHAYAKTAIVLANCCKMGSLLGSCPSEVVEALTAYGYSLGMAMQMRNDLRVLMEPEKDGARFTFATWSGGSLPLPVIHSLRESMQMRLLLSRLEERTQSVARATLLRCLHKTHSIRYAETIVESYAKKAKASLSVLPASVEKSLLVELVDLVIEL